MRIRRVRDGKVAVSKVERRSPLGTPSNFKVWSFGRDSCRGRLSLASSGSTPIPGPTTPSTSRFGNLFKSPTSFCPISSRSSTHTPSKHFNPFANAAHPISSSGIHFVSLSPSLRCATLGNSGNRAKQDCFTTVLCTSRGICDRSRVVTCLPGRENVWRLISDHFASPLRTEKVSC